MITNAINSYVWELWNRDNDWERINSLIPIIPAQQQPELMNSPKPFAVYQSSSDFNNGEIEVKDVEVIYYVIYGNDMNQINDSIETVKDAFKAFNSAENITRWIHSPSNNLDPRDKYIVTYTEVMDTLRSNPSSSEGGKYDGYVAVRVGYHTTPRDFSI